MAIWRVRVISWKPKTTETHSEYVIIADFFPTAKMVTRTLLYVTLIRTVHVLRMINLLAPELFF